MGRFDDSIGTRSGSRKALIGGPNAGAISTVFNPKSLITGAGGFWTALTGVSHSGSNVTSWVDQSSFSQNLSPSSTAPTYSATGLNSHPGITFVASDSEYLGNTSFSFSASATASGFMLLSLTQTPSNYDGYFCFQANGDSNDFNSPHSFAGSAQGSDTNFEVDIAGTQNNTSPNFGTSTPTLIGFTYNAGTVETFINGVSNTSSSPSSTTLGASGSSIFVIAGRISGTIGGDFGNIIAGHCGLTQRLLTSTDWTNLVSYSNTNWGLSL